MRRSVVLLAGILAGCATYTPLPLNRDAALRPPDLAALSSTSAPIRPWLAPRTIDLAKPLDGVAIATISVLANPDLKAARAKAEVAEAQAFAARLLPDPTLTLGASPVLSGPDPFVDLVGALGVDLATLRTRGVRVAQATGAAQQARLDLAWAEWQTAGQARLQAIRVTALTRLLALAEAGRSSARSLFDRQSRAAGRGDVTGDQVQTARTALAAAEASTRNAQKDLTAARFELTRLLGLPPATVLQLVTSASTDVPLNADRLFAIARVDRTDLQALVAGYDAQEAAVRGAILNQFPTLALTVNANRDTSGNLIVGPTVDLTLPLWNRNRGGIATERATRAQLKTEYEARLFQTRAEIAAAIAGIEVARRQRDSARADLPSIERYAAATRRAAARGDLPASTADSAEQTVRDRRTLIAQAEQDEAEQMIALELLTGTLRETWVR